MGISVHFNKFWWSGMICPFSPTFLAGSDLSGCMIAEALANSTEKGVCKETRSD